MLRRGLVGSGEYEHLDLVELMHPEYAGRVFPVGPRFPPETGREPCIPERKIPFIQDLIGVIGGERDFGGSHEEQLVTRIS